MISPVESHPWLSLGDYFEAIKKFILRDSGRPLFRIINEQFDIDLGHDEVDKILIRSEKHGALYHLASVEVSSGGRSIKLSVSTAVSEEARACLRQEFHMLKLLNDWIVPSYLPRPYFEGEVRVCTEKEPLCMCLAEWFDDYYEWHFSIDRAQDQRICIWDLKNGYRFASKREEYEIFRQASEILTLYYNTRDFSQIYPWHHAAGDFVVRNREGTLDLKLTTVRRYGPVKLFSQEDTDPLVAMIYFFLNLSVRMRLDRLDGIGRATWAGDLSLKAIVQGFFQGLSIMEANGRYHLGRVRDLLSLLKSFDQQELKRLFYPLLDLYATESPGDLWLIQANLDGHVRQLCQVMQAL